MPHRGEAVKTTQHLGFWLLLAVLGFVAAPLLRSGPSMEAYLRSEIEETRTAMGENITRLALSLADAMLRQGPAAVLMAVVAQAQHTPEEQQLGARVAGPGGAAASSLFNSYLQGLVLHAYVAAIRAALVLFWAAALAPLLVASIYDGLMQRRVKQAEFGSLRPATFTLAGMLVIPIVSFPVLYLTLPISVSPALAPLWTALVAWPLSILVANSQPLFGR